ncbi:MAG: hypothetical protein WCF84_07235 [Anaerolineae bacterium]
MPKKSESTRNSASKKAAGPHTPRTVPKPKGSPEYLEYLERYAKLGEGRPRLSAEEFDKLDDELLELLDATAGKPNLSDDQIIRIQELEYLLIDSE